ncbi:MAG TPA: chemotaxis protein CheB [Candidatus Acidoferrales bacterium]|nr:chemotaxis protein CheB [Candidatus Acidoferrales bacterium]
MRRDLIVIGASAGGVEALKILLKGLPADLPASVMIVLHTSPRADAGLPRIFARSSALPISDPDGGVPLRRGHVYVAVPDRHLLVEDSHAAAVMGPKENRSRPAIDVLFRSAARHFRARVIGVILTGLLDDGTTGMWEIKRHHGITIVQDPKEAQYPQMPRSVLEHVAVDYCLPLAKISSLLNSLCRQEFYPVAQKAISAEDSVMKTHDTHLTCPECGGPLQHLKYGRLDGFRCRVGHAYSPQSALTAHAEKEEAALWHAVVALEEGADLAGELSGSLGTEFSQKLRKEAGAKKSLAKSIRCTLQALPKVTAHTEPSRSTRKKKRRS